MTDRRSTPIADARRDVGDCLSLFHVLGIILAADLGPLDGFTRGALVDVARLGRERASAAFDSVDGDTPSAGPRSPRASASHAA